MPDSDIQAKQMEISRTVLICAVLAAATFVAFEQVRNNDFVHYDDKYKLLMSMQKGLNLESPRGVYDFVSGQLASADVDESPY
jgi:hypothetical protein